MNTMFMLYMASTLALHASMNAQHLALWKVQEIENKSTIETKYNCYTLADSTWDSLMNKIERGIIHSYPDTTKANYANIDSLANKLRIHICFDTVKIK